MQSVTITDREAGQRLDKFLQKYFAGAQNSFLYKMMRKKNITLNRKKAEGKEILSAGDTVESFFSDETFVKMRGNTESAPDAFEAYRNAYRHLKGISVLYEDEDVLFLNKPAGIFSQISDEGDLSVNEWMIGYLLEEKKMTWEDYAMYHPGVCNRLDRNTSGIILCGKTLKGAQELSRLLKERNLVKQYRSICKGVLKADLDLQGYLVKDTKKNQVQFSKEYREGSDPVHTQVHPLRCSENVTELLIDLHTGKTHQIRAHLASAGHPLIGDSKYGDSGWNARYRKAGLTHQLLHAYRIAFPQDASERVPSLNGLEVISPLPAIYETIARLEFE